MPAGETKPCRVCSGMIVRVRSIGERRWQRQMTCSRACAAVWRKQHRKMDPVAVAQSRDRVRAGMTAHWVIQKGDSARYQAEPPPRLPREAEEAAIARFVAERGVTRAPTADQEVIPSRQEQHRPQPMAGWRG